MTSYAAGSSSLNLRSYANPTTGGLGGQALQRARAAGMTDDQIRQQITSQRIPVGAQAASALGIQATAVAPPGSSGGYQTLSGMNLSSGLDALTGLANKYSDNPTLSNMVVGKIADTFATQANMGLDLAYQRDMIGTLSEYQYGLENLRAGNALKMIGAEGAIAKDIAQLDSRTQVKVGQLGLDGIKYSADKSLQGAMYTSDRSLEGSKYAADRQFQGIKYTADEATNRVRVQGDEDRKTLAENTNQTVALRNDARRAIRSQGTRFYS